MRKDPTSLKALYRDLDRYKVPTIEEEREWLGRIDTKERELVKLIFSYKAAIPQFLEALFKNCEPEVKERAKKAENQDLHEILVDTVRWTDKGRKWLQATCTSDKNAFPSKYGRVKWLSKVKEIWKWLASERNKFISCNMRLVVSMALKNNRVGSFELSDLVQEGSMGLLKAIERFDVNRGFRFSTYASWWVRQSINRYALDKGRSIRLPVHVMETIHKVNKIEREILLEGEIPTDIEIHERSGLGLDKIQSVHDARMTSTSSLDAPIGENDSTLIDVMKDPEAESPFEETNNRELFDTFQELFKSLQPFEAEILKRRFGLRKRKLGSAQTLKVIGDEYKLSRERIRQLEERAKFKLSKMSQLSEFL